MAGAKTAVVLDELRRATQPGVTTAELDALAVRVVRDLGGECTFFGYHGFPGHICASINEEVVHGIPGERRIQEGDIVSLDVGVTFDGFIGDCATTVMVAVTDPDVVRLVRTAERALEAAIAQAVPGNRVGDISHAVESLATAAGFSVVRDFVGHGVGRKMHEDPQIPNFGAPHRGPVLRPGMTLAIEPMLNLGRAATEVLRDGWTVVTKDRRPSAHVEHTIAVQASGPAEILTWIKKS